MSLNSDIKYAHLICNHLILFKIKKTKPFLASFRCPYCGDSKSNPYKTRGYLFEAEDHLVFKCMNCGFKTNLAKLVEHVDPLTYQNYMIECFQEKAGLENKPFVTDISKISKKRFQKYEPLKNLKSISQLNHSHPAKVYVENRKIPTKYHYKLFYAPKFCEWVNTLLPEKFDEKALAIDEPRLVIPFIDQNGYVFGFQGRSFNQKSKVRYITIMLDDQKLKVFGLDDVDSSERVYVIEGPIDSMFIDNAIAMAGSDIDVSRIHKLGIELDKLVFVYDNEPRNPEIINKIQDVINAGIKICIWPTSPLIKEDINDLIKRGILPSEIKKTIDDNAYSGLEAMLKFGEWKKYKKNKMEIANVF